MADIAGSGGYWIACGADRILANPGTLTGSIGVVGSKPVLKELFQKMGVKTEIYREGEHADIFTLSREFTEEERKIMDELLNHYYVMFMDRVAKTRDLDPENVAEIAQGKVYTGVQAKDIFLIDKLGGLYDAVETARELAGIQATPHIVYYIPSATFFGSYLATRLQTLLGLNFRGSTELIEVTM